MSVKYMVWVSVELVDEDNDRYEEVDLPESAGTFKTEVEAIECAAGLTGPTKPRLAGDEEAQA